MTLYSRDGVSVGTCPPFWKTRLLIVTLSTIGFVSCASQAPMGARGRVVVSIDPDPIVGFPVSGGWEFPFLLEIQEVGGVDVDLERVSIRVFLSGTKLYEVSMEAEDLDAKGYETALVAGTAVFYHFEPWQVVPNPKLLSRIVVELEIRGRDGFGRRVKAIREVPLVAAGF